MKTSSAPIMYESQRANSIAISWFNNVSLIKTKCNSIIRLKIHFRSQCQWILSRLFGIGTSSLCRFNNWANILMKKSMTLVKEQLGLLAIKNRKEIYLHIKLGDVIWKLHSLAPRKNKVKSFRDKMQNAIRPRLIYTKVHLLNTNRNK